MVHHEADFGFSVREAGEHLAFLEVFGEYFEVVGTFVDAFFFAFVQMFIIKLRNTPIPAFEEDIVVSCVWHFWFCVAVMNLLLPLCSPC